MDVNIYFGASKKSRAEYENKVISEQNKVEDTQDGERRVERTMHVVKCSDGERSGVQTTLLYILFINIQMHDEKNR